MFKMKFFVTVLFVLFIGNIIEEKIVGGTLGDDYLRTGNEMDEYGSVIYNKSCNSTDFEKGTGCTLICAVNCTVEVTDIKSEWIYKAHNTSNDSYPIVDGKVVNYSPENYTLILDLKDYRSGLYIALLECTDQQLNCSFNISNTEGVPLGGSCTNSTNCTAINAECDEKNCVCNDDYPAKMTNSPDTPACLPEVSTGCECMADSQCHDDDTNLYCQKKKDSDFGICSCADHSYHVRYVEEEGKMMCIRQEGYDYECDYDEECDFADPFMECDSHGYCDCEYGYYFDYYYDRCEYNPWTAYLSVTAVIGIVFGVIFVVILIMVAFALCLRPKRFNRSPPVPPSTVDNQFSSFTEPAVMWNAGQEPAYPMDGLPNYTEAGGLDSPPPPFESDVVIKTRLEDPPVENSAYSNPFRQEEPLEQQPPQLQWFAQQNQPSQVQQHHPDLYTPQSIPSQTQHQQQQVNTSPDTREQLNSNEMFFFQNPNYQTNSAFEEDC